MAALRQFEAVEANIVKAERVWSELRALIPDGVSYGNPPGYDDKRKVFIDLMASLPAIEGWRPEVSLMSLNDIASNRFEIMDLLFNDISAQANLDEVIEQPAEQLREYRFRFNKQRRNLIRKTLGELVGLIDSDVQVIEQVIIKGRESTVEESEIKISISQEVVDRIWEHLSQIETLLGSSVAKPSRWGDMHRHLRFAEPHDFKDIVDTDWPAIKRGLEQTVYEANEPLPVEVQDLAVLIKTNPSGPIKPGLQWEKLDAATFERLIFTVITAVEGYENPRWLMATNAPDRGRDLSVERVVHDPLMGTTRQRTIIQCKHWLSKSVSIGEVAILKEQMKLWGTPRVDIVIIATSGRFTTDAVQAIESQNQSDSALHIAMWPESHLEALLAARPDLIAQFGLR